MQLSTKWEISIHTLKYVLGSRNDDLLTIGGHVLAVPTHTHTGAARTHARTMAICRARTTVTFHIDDHYNVLAPTLKIYPTIFTKIHSNDRPTK